MASVTTSIVKQDLTGEGGKHDYQYEFELVDNDSVHSFVYIWRRGYPADHDTAADRAALVNTVLGQQADNEFNEILSKVRAGEDPYHIDQGGYFTQEMFLWSTWDDYFNRICEVYWSSKSRLDVVPFNLVWSHAVQTEGSKGIKTSLGITQQTYSDMGADMQTAINTQTTLDAYTPHYTDKGWA